MISFLKRKLKDLTRRFVLSGTDLIHIYSPTTGKDHYVLMSDLRTPGGYPDWIAKEEGYALGDKVTYGLKLWESLVDGNTAVPSEGVNWTEVSETSGGAQWGYIEGDIHTQGDIAAYFGELNVSVFRSFSWKGVVRAATTGSLPDNTASEDFQTLTSDVNGTFAIDGILATDDWQLAYFGILVKDEEDRTKNGLYTIEDPGSFGTPWVLRRLENANTSIGLVNAIVPVAAGEKNADTIWKQKTDDITLGATDIEFELFGVDFVLRKPYTELGMDEKTLALLSSDGYLQVFFNHDPVAGGVVTLLCSSPDLIESSLELQPNNAALISATTQLKNPSNSLSMDEIEGLLISLDSILRFRIDKAGLFYVNLGDDEEGDIYYRNADGNFVRLPIGLPTEVLTTVAGKPSWQPPLNPDVDSFYKDFTDFYESTLSGGWAWVSFGAGATTVLSDYGVNSTEKASGVISLTTGTTSGGETHHYKGHAGGFPTAFLIGNGSAISLKWRAALGAVSDGANTYSVTLALGDQVNAKDQLNGVYFTYTHGVNAGKWEAVTANGGTRTTVDTGIAAGTSYQVLEIRINEAGTEAKFYIDGALVATITTNLPLSTTCAIMMNIVKSVGTSSRSLYLDYYQFQTQRSTAR